ncbi:B-cell receptor CD22-like isoform X1 [Entelurus aequoreus]|uniref:B-cell receptor CD22-like isoform X1 n=1 Tax=Entelurus aequoreus TaxID=161455 RepID=UPI002B1CE563|nr:B-cell receptor CD22-like isoform X1 [Entelurus aequoreus]
MPGLLSAEWGGTYTEEEICAIKGSTVKLQCSFKFPPTEGGREIKVKETFWFTKDPNEDLRLDPQYFGGVQSECHGNICSLTIADVRRSDEYTFRFTTNHSRGDFIVTPAVKVTVIDLKVQVPKFIYAHGTHWYDLKCVSTTCSPWSPSSYIWYKNGEKIQNEKSQVYTVEHDYKDSYSCAVRGHEQAVSPPECVAYTSCNKVVYSKRHICAIQGSSLDIKCEYTSYGYTQKKFWYRTDSSHRRNPSMTEDLRSDPQYEGRVELPSETSGNSTLRIKNVRQNDSAEYRFKFTTSGFKRRSILPGSTLTVAAVQVQVMSVTVEDSHLVAQMLCHTSCLPEAPFSFVWQHNGKYIKNGAKVEVTLSPGDYITCAAQQHQHISISPHLYVLKRPSVSLSHTGDILEGRPLTLTCYIDNFNYSSATVDYCWYNKKKNVSSKVRVLKKDRQLVFKSIKSSDSAEYWCTVENQLGKKTSEPVFIDVHYPPRRPSLFVSLSGVIVEGQSVNLTCSSNANPAANYTWYKDNQFLTQKKKNRYSLTSIRPEDAGTFHCMSENKHGRVNSSSVVINVQRYWVLTMAAAVGSVVVLVVLVLTAFLVLRKKRQSKKSNAQYVRGGTFYLNSLSSTCESRAGAAGGEAPNQERNEVVYSQVCFANSSDGPVDASTTPVVPLRRLVEEEKDGLVYATVKNCVSGPKPQGGAGENLN